MLQTKDEVEISVKNYKNNLPADLLKKAGNCVVRECDETEKGHFIAYVDQGNESFDVSLTISTSAVITAHTCDCKTKINFCVHKTALLLYIDKQSKKGAKPAPKISKAASLLDATDPAALKEWISNLLAKNKDIELSFVHFFSGRNAQYTPGQVLQLTNDTIKAVVKNKKNTDLTQTKKLVELWTDVHEPVVQQYLADTADNNAFLNFHSLTEACTKFQSGVPLNTNRIQKYIIDLLQRVSEAINNIPEEKTWSVATGFFMEKLKEDRNKIRLHYLMHLEHIINAAAADRKVKLLNALASQYRQLITAELENGSDYTLIIFNLVELNDMFPCYYDMFKPILFNNDFNEKLIRHLIDNRHLKMAEKFCLEQILRNYKEEYNILYLELLKEIYTLNKNEAKLAKVLTELFPLNFNMDDFLFVTSRMKNEEEQKKFRTKMITKARHSAQHRNSAASLFCFNLMDHEKKYKKMIEYIQSDTSYGTILNYFEPMFLTDRELLLRTLLLKDDGFLWHGGTSNEESHLPALAEKMCAHYTADYLKKVIAHQNNQKYYSRTNVLFEYLDQILAAPSGKK